MLTKANYRLEEYSKTAEELAVTRRETGWGVKFTIRWATPLPC